MKQETVLVKGMFCAACSASVERVVGRLPFVERASVNLANEKLFVIYDETSGGMEQIAAAVQKAGFTTAPYDGTASDKARRDEQEKQIEESRKRLTICLIFSIPLMYICMGHMLSLPLPEIFKSHEYALINALVQLALTIPVLISGKRFYVSGYKSLVSLAPTMDSLVAVSTTASMLYSITSTVRILGGEHEAMNELYYDSAAMIITFVTLGKYFEARAKRKTGDAIASLFSLAPKTAVVIKDGKEYEVPTEMLKPGDIIMVKPGERVAADGEVTDGASALDESMLTGESLPIEKKIGDMVTGGTLNTYGSLRVKVTHTEEEGTLHGIITLVEEAQSKKAPISRLADKVAGIFVPCVFAAAFIAAAIWLIAGKGFPFALRIFVAVLVVACPCALGLATPTAVMVGTGRAAKLGILFRNGEALETLHKVDTVFMDKTGTLTSGKPSVTDIFLCNGVNEEELLKIAYAAEKNSEHPLAKAVCSYCEEKNIAAPDVCDFEAVPGKGVTCILDGKKVVAGNETFIKENGIDILDAGEASADFGRTGKTVLFFADGEKLLGMTAVADTVKEDSADAISNLLKIDIDCVMLTGDSESTAKSVAEAVGIKKYFASLLPDGKTSLISKAKEEKHITAFVGDGINDAPSLALADVGIAMGTGADIAAQSADVVLPGSSPMGVVRAINLSKAVLKVIKENLFWAFFYNILGIPVAAGLLYAFGGPLMSPMVCAATMSLSSVTVVSNALRLGRVKIETK